MRLFEVADRFVDDLETALRLQIKGARAKKSSEPLSKESEPLSYPGLSQLLYNIGGYGKIDFKDFARIYDENPSIASLVADYNQEYIILGTDEETMPKSNLGTPEGPSVDQMASQGAAAHLNSLS